MIPGTRDAQSSISKITRCPPKTWWAADSLASIVPVSTYQMAELAKTAGGSIEIINLPDLGIKGNSHFAMMEKNNAEVADVIHKWLAGKGLVD